MLVLGSNSLGYAPALVERRAHLRAPLDEAAELVIPSENLTLSCQLVNISEGGAGIACDMIPCAGTKVILVLKDGRRFDSVTAWYGDGELGLRFTAVNQKS
ncbi:MAG TPA: PilZ domain-containing protein [Rhizomicrobium sp.]|nr:PilZ domain-containing protein [Rhizomicrobium sp.]